MDLCPTNFDLNLNIQAQVLHG